MTIVANPRPERDVGSVVSSWQAVPGSIPNVRRSGTAREEQIGHIVVFLVVLFFWASHHGNLITLDGNRLMTAADTGQQTRTNPIMSSERCRDIYLLLPRLHNNPHPSLSSLFRLSTWFMKYGTDDILSCLFVSSPVKPKRKHTTCPNVWIHLDIETIDMIIHGTQVTQDGRFCISQFASPACLRTDWTYFDTPRAPGVKSRSHTGSSRSTRDPGLLAVKRLLLKH